MTPYPPEVMPWYRSKIIVGALVSIITKLLVVSGLTGEFTATETSQIADLALIVIGGIGDLVAIGARVRQRYVPQIVASQGQARRATLSAFLACILILPLMGCAGIQRAVPSSSAQVADQVTIDEQAALTLTLAYTAAARSAALAIETGIVRDPVTVRRIGELDQRAFAAVKTAERAYRAGNADSYAIALSEAREAVSTFLGNVKGERP